MSNTLPPLILPVTGDMTGLASTLTKVQQQVGMLGSKMSASISQQATGALKGLGNAFQGLVAPMIAAGSAYLTFSAGMEALNRADALGKASASLGITAEKLQKLQIIARQTGGSAGGMNMALREMSKNLAQAEAGEEGAVVALAKLGFKVAEFQGLKPDESFVKIADAMSNMESSSRRLQSAQEIFGRGSRDIAETLTIGKKGFDEISESARKYGMIMSADEVRVLKDMNDQIEMMKIKMESMVSKSMLEFKDTIEFINRDLSAGKDKMGALQAIAFVLSKAFAVVYAVVSDILKVFVSIGVLISAAFAVIAQSAMEFFGDVAGGFKYLYDVAKVSFDMIGGAWDFYVGGMKLAFWKFVELFEQQFVAIAKKIGPHLTKLGDIMRDFGIAGGESLAGLGWSMEQFAADSPNTIKAGMDAAAAQVTAGTNKMSQTIKSIGNVKFSRPQWAKDAAQWFSDLKDESWKTFTGMRSSIQALAKDWFGLGTKAEEANKKMKGGKGTAGPSDAFIKSLTDDLAAYKKFLDEMNKLSEEAAKVRATTDDPVDDEQKRYDAQLTMARKFHGDKLSSDAQYNEQSLKMEQTHTDKMDAITSKRYEDAAKKAIDMGANDWGRRQEEINRVSELEEEAYQERLAAIMERSGTEEEMNKAIDAAAQMHADARVGIARSQAMLEQEINQQKWAAISGMMGQAAALMDKNNRAQFTAWKVFASGQAIINALLSFSNIIGDQRAEIMYGPVGQIAMATASLTLGMAAAAKIAATPYGGGGGANVGGGGGGGGGNTGANAARNQSAAGGNSNVNVTLYGDSFSGSQVRGMISAINEAAGDNMNLKTQVAQ